RSTGIRLPECIRADTQPLHRPEALNISRLCRYSAVPQRRHSWRHRSTTMPVTNVPSGTSTAASEPDWRAIIGTANATPAAAMPTRHTQRFRPTWLLNANSARAVSDAAILRIVMVANSVLIMANSTPLSICLGSLDGLRALPTHHRPAPRLVD